MRGIVEVYEILSDGSEDLIFKDSNLVVDTGHEAVVDMLTTPSSVLGINPRIMDTSNFRIGAMSFGPALSSFSENAYTLSTVDKVINPQVSSWYQAIADDHIMRVLWNHDTQTSTYIPPYQLPSYPDPLDTQLEPLAKTALMTASSVPTVSSFGQFENRINFSPNDTSSYFQGAYPHTSGSTIATTSSLELDFQTDTWAGFWASATVTSTYNEKGNMDYRGFVSATPIVEANPSDSSGVVSFRGYGGQTNASAFFVEPKVVFETTIGYGDSCFMNMYGGLHQIGLWSLDCQQSLKNGTAPFAWVDSNGVTPREFKLFAKKTFTENLVRRWDQSSPPIDGLASPNPLKIKWMLDFRSVR